MAELNEELRRSLLKAAHNQVLQAEDEFLAYRKFLGLCLVWLPQGYLRDIVRQVSKGRSAAEAWRALGEMGVSGGD